MSSQAQPGIPTREFRHPRCLRRALPAGRFLGLGLLLGLAACSHYQLGTRGKLAFTTLYVAPVENRALLPQAQAIVATAVREALLQDGRVTLLPSAETAEATLRITLTGYEREVAAASSTDTGLARKFALHLQAACTLTDNRTGRPLFDGREITVTRDVYVDSGQVPAEYQALPLLAGALADRVTHAVLDVW
ncbi:MAG: LPS assembly lipoprotein LptE [Opitutaceae bacterium]|nr:LPS assembly lipoprotein LptE [Opitutaceae bacterium]